MDTQKSNLTTYDFQVIGNMIREITKEIVTECLIPVMKKLEEHDAKFDAIAQMFHDQNEYFDRRFVEQDRKIEALRFDLKEAVIELKSVIEETAAELREEIREATKGCLRINV